MPVGILGSLRVCTVLYILVSGRDVGLVPYKGMRGQAGAAGRRRRAGGAQRRRHDVDAPLATLRVLVTLGALAGLTS